MWNRAAEFWLKSGIDRRTAPDPGPFLVSVGNLALGGTGKTPLIMALARDLHTLGLTGCILTRGYKSPLKGPLVVDPENILAGDEARLMAAHLQDIDWPVVQSRNRLAGSDYIRGKLPGRAVVLLEDCHQTRSLGRHLDVLILDRWSVTDSPDGQLLEPLAGPVFPLGPYRESAAGAHRAQILVVEAENNPALISRKGQAVASFSRQSNLAPLQPSGLASGLPEKFGVISGIARPQAFEKATGKLVGRTPLLAVRLQDHQPYSPRLVRSLVEEFRKEQALAMVTTAKDWVKLQPFWPQDFPAWVVQQEVRWGRTNALPQLVRERAES